MIYHVLANLNHDNREYQRGDTIELSEGDSAARRLLELSVISADPAPVVGTPAEPEPEAPDRQPEVGGTRTETGEPSLDGRDGEGERKEATDVSPKVNEVPLDRMNRAQLEVAARAAGIPDDKIAAAETKKVLIGLIQAETPETNKAPGAEVAPGLRVPVDREHRFRLILNTQSV